MPETRIGARIVVPSPAGVGGVSSAFTWTQGTPEATWTIPHNLGFPPGGFIVIDSAGSIIEGDIVSMTSTMLVLTFGAAFSGVAYLS